MELQVMAMYCDLDDLPRAYAYGDISELRAVILHARKMLVNYLSGKGYNQHDINEYSLQLETIEQ